MDELSGIVARKKQLVSRDTDEEAGGKILRRYSLLRMTFTARHWSTGGKRSFVAIRSSG